ncbi:MAG: hypothetical protein NZ581_07605 [Candidatus Caldarchaeum sp.]|nr:hypothetical protein [Candidatus Caldarchaeum sp.]MDW8436041.1 hypothetical protein [Candidatus Caldarchaeum sp.]
MSKTVVKGKWASRFILAAIIQGALATGLTLFWVVSQFGLLRPEFSRVIAFGSAGNWFTVGYTTYMTVGVVGMAVTALFYYFIENVLNKPYTGMVDKLAWVHLVCMNVGVVGATWLMMVVGYLGGAALLPPQVGGLGWTPAEVHEKIFYGIPLGYPTWIVGFIFLLAVGVVAGGLGYIISWRKS